MKANYPNVKIFGSEGMLEMEAADNNWPWFYHKQILDSPQARNNIDILAVHGYSDGVAPTSGSTLGHLWSSHKSHFARSDGQAAMDDRDVRLSGRLERHAGRVQPRPGHHVRPEQRQHERLGLVAGEREPGLLRTSATSR